MKFFFSIFVLLSAAAKAADTNALPALAPAYGEMPPTFWEQHGTLVIVGILTFVVLAILVLWKLVQPKPAVILPPEVLVRDALAKLIGQPEDGKLLSDISQILRRYVVAVFELSAAEMTTKEFSAALAANEKIGTEVSNAISNFLHDCDEQKFSSSPSAASLNAVTRALELVVLIEKRRAQIAAAK